MEDQDVSRKRTGGNLGDESKDLSELVSRDAHPVLVSIIEAMRWVDEPFSPGDVARMHAEPPTLGAVVYHMQTLVSKLPVLRLYAEDIIRGAIMRSYYFQGRTPASMRDGRAG
jgi:hypothetical protein